MVEKDSYPCHSSEARVTLQLNTEEKAHLAPSAVALSPHW